MSSLKERGCYSDEQLHELMRLVRERAIAYDAGDGKTLARLSREIEEIKDEAGQKWLREA